MKSLALSLLLLTGASPAPMLDVDLQLVLCVDSSQSIDPSEYVLQHEGIALAFASPQIIDAIKGGALGRIVVSLVEFSDGARVRIPPVVVSDAASARKFAETVIGLEREVNGQTGISLGISMSIGVITGSPYRATRRVIDVSGDGSNNADEFSVPINMTTVRELALRNKITVNGLPIEGEEADIIEFYRQWVLTGRDAFLIPAKDVTDFAQAIRRKLILEIS